MTTRPTSGMVKESLFNIIAGEIEASYVLDVFAGTGSLGIEALSRGAQHAVFMDKSSECCSVIRENLAHTKLADRSEVYHTDFENGISKLGASGKKFDLILLDPPYHKNFVQEALKILMNNDIMNKSAIIVAEHSISDILPESFGNFIATGPRKYGDTALTIYRPADDGI